MTEKVGLNRREFLRLAGLSAVGAAFLSGCGNKATLSDAEKLAGGSIEFSLEKDVVIIGSGAAGLWAAYGLVKAGISPLLIEKSPSFGGDSILACGVLPVHDTAAMAAQGVDDTPADEYWEQIKDYFAEERVPKLSEIGFKYGKKCVDIWTDELGVEWMPFDEGYTYYFHVVAPGLGSMHNLLTPLYNHVVAAGTEVMFETRATQFIINDENELVGVRVQDEFTKQITDIRAKRILLATGDFVSNQEKVARYLPMWASKPTSTYTSMGEGLDLGLSVGGSLERMEDPEFLMADNAQIIVWGYYDPLIHVTPTGKRFWNENDGHHVADALVEAGFYHWYCIFDNQLMNSNRRHSVDAIAGLNRMVSSDTIEGLAQLINVPEANLVETLENYNRMCAAGEDTEFGRKRYLSPLSPPFYAALATPVRYKSLGGLRVNENCQVIDAADGPIPNLYAAGSVSGTISPNLAPVAASGLWAAEKIAADLQSGA